MISFSQALEAIRNEVQRKTPVELPVAETLGLVCAAQYSALEPQPMFANSAMDGFAVRSHEATELSTKFMVIGSSAAGDAPPGHTADPQASTGAWEIMTGAPLPGVYDAVIRIEDVIVSARNSEGRPSEITLLQTVEPGQNVRNIGEDMQAGDVVLEQGTIIGPQHIKALAMVGASHIRVCPRPHVKVIATGKELLDDPNQALVPGQIRNSNGPFLMAAMKSAGTEADYLGTVPDEPEMFLKMLADCDRQRPDMVISSGAVSMGRYDFVPECLEAHGARIIFHKAAVRPGKPVLFAILPGGSIFFGLPGNPIAVAAGARFFVSAALACLQGLEPERFQTGKLTAHLRKKKDLCFFARAWSGTNARGELEVEVLTGQASFMISSYLKANSWVILDEPVDEFEAGQLVKIVPLHGEPRFGVNISTPGAEALPVRIVENNS